MNIRLLTKEDISYISAIQKKIYSEETATRFTLEVQDMFSNQRYRPTFFVVEDDNEIVGFGGFMQSWIHYDIYELFWIGIAQKFQGKGLGKALVKRLIKEIKAKKGINKARKIIAATDKPSYYEKNFGFKKIELIKETKSWIIGFDV